ncbi:MAG: porphobilinogen synthase [Chlamydiales bacterium]|nr:porphobilinogen synthase [Chlamydiales bacterium]
MSKRSGSLNRPYLTRRPRRNRKNPAIRDLVSETQLSRSDFVIPLFLKDGTNFKKSLPGLPSITTFSIDCLIKEIEIWLEKGFYSYALFPVVVPELKDPIGSYSYESSNFIIAAIKEIKSHFPEVCLFLDIALDPFTSHGHDGVLNSKGEVDNDQSLIALGKMALAYASAGVDVLAPSDMMDGRIGFIRENLDTSNFQEVSLLAYTAKYASSCYGPFRDTVGSSLKGGDKLSYQLNPANSKEAMLELKLDEEEGADMVMVKPALGYLDIIERFKGKASVPIAAYHVSGEYAMVIAAAEKGWVDKDRTIIEHLTSIKRAGADIIFSYAFKEVDSFLSSKF